MLGISQCWPIVPLKPQEVTAGIATRWHQLSGSWASPSIMGFLVGLGFAGEGLEGIVAWISNTTLWPAGSHNQYENCFGAEHHA